jgi:hypothetical protein
MSAPKSNAEATLAFKGKLAEILVDLGAEDDKAPTTDEIEAAKEIVDVIWEVMEMRVISVGEVTGMVNLGIPTNIFAF